MQLGPQAGERRYYELRDYFRGTIVLFVSLVIAFAATLWSKAVLLRRSAPRAGGGATMIRLRGVTGWPRHVDAIASLAGARRVSQIHGLRSILIEGVGRDGTIDVTHPDSFVRYVFQSEPLRNVQGGGADSNTKALGFVCPKQTIKLMKDGLLAEPANEGAQCPRDLGESLPLPSCGPREVWAKARTKGIGEDDTGRLDYSLGKEGPVWKLTVPSKRFSLVLSSDCKQEHTRERSIARPSGSSSAHPGPKKP